jgi:hypothetical protein
MQTLPQQTGGSQVSAQGMSRPRRPQYSLHVGNCWSPWSWKEGNQPSLGKQRRLGGSNEEYVCVLYKLIGGFLEAVKHYNMSTNFLGLSKN